MKSYKAVVIGCGRIGALLEGDPLRPKPATHAGMWASASDVELVGLMDSSDAARDQIRNLFPGIDLFEDAAKMLKACRPDIVSIATNSESHGFYIALCAKAGIPVIVSEKPLDAEFTVAKTVVTAVRQSQSALFVNHVRRYSPLLRDLQIRISDGEFGEFMNAQGSYVHGLNGTGTHMIDMFRMLLEPVCGTVETVQGTTSKIEALQPAGDPNTNATLHMSRGGLITMAALSMRDYDVFEAVLYFRKARVVIRDLARTFEIFRPIAATDKTGFVSISQSADEVRHDPHINWFEALATNVVDVLKGTSHPQASGEDSLATLAVVDAIRESAMLNGAMVTVGSGPDSAAPSFLTGTTI